MATGVPILVLKEGAQRTYGREALRANILAAKVMAEILKTSLGPRGLDKMLVDAFGDIVVTNDGATIVKEMEVQHPAAKLLVEVAKAQDAEVGDGTTSVVVLAGTLLERAEKLLDENIHPTIIINGFTKALRESLAFLDKIAYPVNVEDDASLRKIVETTLASKHIGHGPERAKIADMILESIRIIAEKRPDGTYNVDLDNVKIEKKKGGSIFDSKIIRGIVLDKEVVHPGMPRRVEGARILVLDAPLEIQKPDLTTKIRVTDVEQLDKFLEEETKLLKDMVEKIAATGANVVITQKGIDEVAQHFLAKKGILAVRRVKRSDIEKLARATGAKIVTDIEDLKPEDLGYAELVEERRVGEDKMVFIEGAKNLRSVTILIRGGFERLVDEADRAIHDALSVVADAVMDGKIVGGAGAIEAEVAKHLYEYARTMPGKVQLAVEAFARALESLPQIIAHNAGHDPIDVLVKIRSAHESPEGKWAGINIETGGILDSMKAGIIEPARVKANAIKAGTEAASLILRIDDLIAAKRTEEKEKGKKEEEKKEED
ncbi:MAG: thermosome subunit beta [Acidilobaceae archaeon]